MTVKTQGGKVITKDGKVSCECCGPDCCFYPAQRLQNGLYPATDLPDTIDFYGTILNRSGTSWGNTTNGVFLESGKWASYRNGSRSERDCLFSGSTKATWEDVYQANVGTDGSGLVYRTSSGFWDGLLGCGKRVTLRYFGCNQGGTPPGINTNPGWELTWQFCNPSPGGQTGTTIGKSGEQDGPLGAYGGGTSVTIP